MLGIGASLTKTATILKFKGGGGGGGDTTPVITGVPTISGTATVGSTLTASPASVSGSPTPTRTWQWARDGVDIGGATSITYDLVAADYGVTITVRQIETNTAGSDDATSAGTAIAWEPAALFQSGELGGYWDASNAASLYQTTDTSTPVTAVSDPVGRMNDLSGNGNHWLQGTPGARPLYQTDGDIKYIDLDGSDDVLQTGTITGLLRRDTTMFVATRYATGGASAAYNFVITGQNGANDYIGPGIRNDSTQRKQARSRLLTNGRAIVANPADATNGSTPPDTYMTISMRFRTAEQTAGRDGTFLTPTAHSWIGTDQVNGVINTGVAAFGVARRILAAIYITRDLTDPELALVQAWMDARINP